MDKRAEMTAFLGPKNWLEVPCIMKRMYSDFIVVEIPTEGKVLQTKMPECDQFENFDTQNTLKRPTDVIEGEAPSKKRLKSESGDGEEVTEAIPKIFTAEDLARIEEVCQGTLESHTVVLQSFTKDERRVGYQYLRNKYENKLVTNSANGSVEIRRWNKETASTADPRESHASRSATDHFPRGHHLFFTLTKKNMDTNHAISLISKFSGLKSSMFHVAGMKDRRAITTQLVCVPNTPMSRVKRAAPKIREIYLANFHYAPRKLQLGNLWGNHFEVVLRELDMEAIGGKAGLTERVEHWSKNGFLNYFGAQRFGSCGVNTAEVGRLILSAQWKEVVDAILSPRPDARGPLAQCLKEYRKSHDATRALNVLKAQCVRSNPRQIFDGVEANLLSILSRNGDSYKDAVLKLPRDARSLYIHAYQSLVFNRVLSRRCEKYGGAPIDGDFGEDGELIANGDVHLPLPSLNDKYPQNEVGEWYKEIAASDGINKDSFTDLEKSFIIGDVYRKIIVKPSSVEWELLTYTDNRAILQSSPFIDEKGAVKLEHKEENAREVDEEAEVKKHALRIKFDLPASCYATVALRELLRTDFSKDGQKKLEGISSVIKTCENGENVSIDMDEQKNAAKEENGAAVKAEPSI